MIGGVGPKNPNNVTCGVKQNRAWYDAQAKKKRSGKVNCRPEVGQTGKKVPTKREKKGGSRRLLLSILCQMVFFFKR